MNSLFYTLWVSSVMLCLGAVFTGWGLLIARLFTKNPFSTSELVVFPLFGWCSTLAVLQIWSLFLPITAFTLTVVAGVGLTSLAVHGQVLGIRERDTDPRFLLFVVILCALACWLATNTIRQPWNYDSGLYHLSSIRWANTYPVVPGLANLHCRLGFNSSYFLYAAMLNVGPFAHKCHQVANGTLFLMTLIPILWGWFAGFRPNGTPRLEALFYALFSVPLAAWVLSPDHASSPSPDAAGFLLGLVMGGQLFSLLQASYAAETTDSYPMRTRWLIILIFIAAGITIKLSFAGFGAAVLLVLLADCLTRSIRRRETVMFLVISVGAGLIFLLPSAIRGISLSGYVAYPLAYGSLPVDWKVSDGQVYMEAGWIKSWARMPHVYYEKVLADWDWVKPWGKRMFEEFPFEVILPLALTGAGLLWLMIRRTSQSRVIPRHYWLSLAAPTIGLAFWFFTAPAPRFAGACFWLLPVATLTLMLAQVRSPVSRFLGCTLFCIILFSQLRVAKLPEGCRWDNGPVRSISLSIRRTQSGLELQVPTDPENDQCWNGPLPCTPKFDHRLRLRDPADLSRGFTFQPIEHGLGGSL